MESDDVLFYWSMVLSNWEKEVASVLLDMSANVRSGPFHYLSLAGVQESKRSVQKSKVRKQLYFIIQQRSPIQ